MRRVKAVAVALLAAAALAGCGPSEGTVVQKQYSPAEWYWTTCYRSETYTTGKTTSTRQVPYTCQQYRPASYSLYLREEVGVSSSREAEEGWRNVSGRVFMACETGQYYEEGKCR